MDIKHTLIFVLFYFAVGGVFSQSIQLVMSPNPSPYISDWQNRIETATLVISNNGTGDIRVKIKAELFDGKGALVANTDPAKTPVLSVPTGVSQYHPEDIFPVYALNYKGNVERTTSQTGRIPDDNYTFCVTLIDPITGESIGTSGTVCRMFSIIAYQAPVLITPQENEIIPESRTKGIVFRWTPVSPTPNAIVTYRLQIFEVLPGQENMTALRSNQPIVEKDLNGILQTQWPIDFAMPDAGMKYVWTVTPLDGEGRNLVDGYGFAQPFGFSLESPPSPNGPGSCECAVLTDLHLNQGSNPISLECDKTYNLILGNPLTIIGNAHCTGSSSCQVKYNITLHDPDGMKVVDDIGDANLVLNYTPVKPGLYTLIICPMCGDKCCGNCVVFFNAEQNCECGSWSSLAYNNTPIVCGQFITNITANQPIAISGTYGCSAAASSGSAACNTTYQWSVTGPGGVQVISLTSGPLLNINFIPTVAGIYTATFTPICGSLTQMGCKTCPSCTISFQVPATCQCGTWTGLTYEYNNVPGITLTPNQTINNIGSNKPIIISGNYTCGPAGCVASLSWTVSNPNGSSNSSGSTMPVTFNTSGGAGTYTVIIVAMCGNKVCTTSFTFNVPPSCDCDKWTSLSYSINNSSQPLLPNQTINNVGAGQAINISGVYSCTGGCTTSISWTVSNPDGTPNSSGSTMPVTFNTSGGAGTFTVIIVAMCGNKVCTTSFAFNVPPSCDCDKWTSLSYSINNSSQPLLPNQTINNVGAGQAINISGVYSCTGGCTTSISWTVSNPDGTPNSSGSTMPVTFNTSGGAGTYTVIIVAMCGNKVCTTSFAFNVPPSCDCDKWTSLSYSINNSSQPLLPNQTINNVGAGQAINISGVYSCTGGCTTSISWTVSNPDGTPNSSGSTMPVTFNTSGGAGTYTVIIVAMCGNKVCTTSFTFNVPPSCDCDKWTSLSYSINNSSQPLLPNQTINNVGVGQAINISGVYSCTGGCTTSISWTVSNPDGTPNSSGSTMPVTFNTSGGAGTYTVIIVAMCGNKVCTTSFTFNVPPSCDCDKWTSLSYSINNSSQPLLPNQTINNVGAGQAINISGVYSCTGGCTTSISWTVSNPDGTPNSSGSTMPVTFNTSGGAGTYTVIIVAMCGNKVCTTSFAFNVPPSCDCDKWTSLSYSINNSSQPLLPNQTINNVGAGQAINISGVYSCTGGCTTSISWTVSNPDGTPNSSGSTMPVTFNTSGGAGTYTVIIVAMCGNKVCTTSFAFNVPPSCDCDKWTSLSYSINNSSQPLLPNQTINNVGAGQAINISGVYSCTGGCTTSISWTVSNPDGTPNSSGSTMPITFSTSGGPGNYTVNIVAVCGSKICPTTFIFNVPDVCPPNGTWNTFAVTGTSGSNPNMNCGTSMNVVAGNLLITGAYISSCNNIKYDWVVSGPVIGLPKQTGQSNLSISFSPSVPGTYSVIITSHCGTAECDKCVLTFVVPSLCPPGGTWHSFIVSGTSGSNPNMSCGTSMNIVAGNLSITGSYISSCNNIKYDWVVSGPVTGLPNLTGQSSISIAFNPSVPGTYSVVITSHCGSAICSSCVLSFVIPNVCPPGGTWTSFLVNNQGVNVGMGCGSIVNISAGSVISVSSGTYTHTFCQNFNYNWVVTGPVSGLPSQTGQSSVSFSFPANTPGTYSATIMALCGNNVCDTCVLTWIVSAIHCLCGEWNGSSVTYSGGGNTGTTACNAKLSLSPGVTYTFTAPLYSCIPSGPSCPPIYQWKVDGNTLGTGPTFSYSFTPGSHLITITAMCGNEPCGRCEIKVVNTDTSCKCDKWITNTLKYKGQGVNGIIACSKKVNVQPGMPYTFTAPVYTCTPAGPFCQPVYKWTVDGVLQGSGPTLTQSFTNGTHTITVSTVCGSVICKSCNYTILSGIIPND